MSVLHNLVSARLEATTVAESAALLLLGAGLMTAAVRRRLFRRL